MTGGVSCTLRASAPARLERAALLAAALLASAPFAASLAARLSTGRVGSLASILICFASGLASPDAPTGRPGATSDHGADCVLCPTLCCGFAGSASSPGLIVAAPIRRFSLRWLVANRGAATRKARRANWARAPPLRRSA